MRSARADARNAEMQLRRAGEARAPGAGLICATDLDAFRIRPRPFLRSGAARVRGPDFRARSRELRSVDRDDAMVLRFGR